MAVQRIKREFTTAQARAIAQVLGADLRREGIELESFRRGLDVELEHGCHDPQTDVTHDDPFLTGKIALAHLRELPDYYDRLGQMEHEVHPRATDADMEAHIWLRFEHQC